eukprot:CAMPEP_0115846478 /NCGR_PEP_ID=MMETSP0287-20121206/9882_1 /TAXON_ID=412157 /ORGANISM="Chrysochromulina rotalis, Strain UIO044" /LENGTH=170 /DNA_ID=CAMNT_0003300271 /DNA_START=568 /DNA_END=1076 /DNA_ORIENTATION=+
MSRADALSERRSWAQEAHSGRTADEPRPRWRTASSPSSRDHGSGCAVRAKEGNRRRQYHPETPVVERSDPQRSDPQRADGSRVRPRVQARVRPRVQARVRPRVSAAADAVAPPAGERTDGAAMAEAEAEATSDIGPDPGSDQGDAHVLGTEGEGEDATCRYDTPAGFAGG